MPEHQLEWFQGGDRPVSGTIYMRPDPDDEARRLRAAEYGGDAAAEWELLSEHVQASWRDEARAARGDVIEIPLPPEPDRSRRLEAYDPETGETRRAFTWGKHFRAGAWQIVGGNGVAHYWTDIIGMSLGSGWRLRSVPRTDGGEQGG